MRRSVFLALIASVALVACSKGPEEVAAPVAEARQPWADFAATRLRGAEEDASSAETLVNQARRFKPD